MFGASCWSWVSRHETRTYAVKTAKDRLARRVTLRRCPCVLDFSIVLVFNWVMTDSQHSKDLFVACQEYRKLHMQPRMSRLPAKSPPWPQCHHVGIHCGVWSVTNNHTSWGSNQRVRHTKMEPPVFFFGLCHALFLAQHTPPCRLEWEWTKGHAARLTIPLWKILTLYVHNSMSP